MSYVVVVHKKINKIKTYHIVIKIIIISVCMYVFMYVNI
jgi:hypothetical protein